MLGLIVLPHPEWTLRPDVIEVAHRFAQQGLRLFAIKPEILSGRDAYANFAVQAYIRTAQKFETEYRHIWMDEFTFMISINEAAGPLPRAGLPGYLHQYELALADVEAEIGFLIDEVYRSLEPIN